RSPRVDDRSGAGSGHRDRCSPYRRNGLGRRRSGRRQNGQRELIMELLSNAEFWVAVGFLVVIGVILYAGAPKMIGKMLDDRAAAIKADLDEAARLRAEAEALLADYKRKSANAESEAAAIVDEARADAERIAAEMRTALAAQIERRGKQAQDKIAQA